MRDHWSARILALAVGTASVAGCDGYHQNEMQKRRQVLQQLLTRNPTVAQVDAEMGNTLYRIASSADAKDLAKIWTNPLNDPVEVQAKVGKWPQTRVYLKSPMVYLIYFNADGVMRDFTCLSN